MAYQPLDGGSGSNPMSTSLLSVNLGGNANANANANGNAGGGLDGGDDEMSAFMGKGMGLGMGSSSTPPPQQQQPTQTQTQASRSLGVPLATMVGAAVGMMGAPLNDAGMSRASAVASRVEDAVSAYGGSLVPCSDRDLRELEAREVKRACVALCCPQCLVGYSVARAGRPNLHGVGVCLALTTADWVRTTAAAMSSAAASPASAGMTYATTGVAPSAGSAGAACGLDLVSCFLFAAVGAVVNGVNMEWGGEPNIARYAVSLCCLPSCFAYSLSRAVDKRNEETGAAQRMFT